MEVPNVWTWTCYISDLLLRFVQVLLSQSLCKSLVKPEAAPDHDSKRKGDYKGYKYIKRYVF